MKDIAKSGSPEQYAALVRESILNNNPGDKDMVKAHDAALSRLVTWLEDSKRHYDKGIMVMRLRDAGVYPLQARYLNDKAHWKYKGTLMKMLEGVEDEWTWKDLI